MTRARFPAQQDVRNLTAFLLQGPWARASVRVASQGLRPRPPRPEAWPPGPRRPSGLWFGLPGVGCSENPSLGLWGSRQRYLDPAPSAKAQVLESQAPDGEGGFPCSLLTSLHSLSLLLSSLASLPFPRAFASAELFSSFILTQSLSHLSCPGWA